MEHTVIAFLQVTWEAMACRFVCSCIGQWGV